MTACALIAVLLASGLAADGAAVVEECDLAPPAAQQAPTEAAAPKAKTPETAPEKSRKPAQTHAKPSASEQQPKDKPPAKPKGRTASKARGPVAAFWMAPPEKR